MEMGPHAPMIAEQSDRIFSAMLTRLEKAIAQAPDIAPDAAGGGPKEMARTVLAFLEGLRVLGKTGQTKAQVARSVECMTASLLPQQGRQETPYHIFHVIYSNALLSLDTLVMEDVFHARRRTGPTSGRGNLAGRHRPGPKLSTCAPPGLS